jgi:hypothetical protein
MPNSHPKLTAEDRQRAAVDASRCVSSHRHRLDPIPMPPGAPRPTFGALLAERCDTCGTIRYAHVSRLSGELIGPYRYDRPEWYQAALSDKHDTMWWRATYWDTLDSEYFLNAEPETTATVTSIKRRRRAS